MPAARRPIQKSTPPPSVIDPKDPVPRMPIMVIDVDNRELGCLTMPIETIPKNTQDLKPKPPEEITFAGPYLIEVTLDNDKAPISGRAVYMVVGEDRHSTQLLYPWTLEHFTIPTADFQRGQGLIYWPFDRRTAPEYEKLDATTVGQRMYDRLVGCIADGKRHYNTRLTLDLIAALQGKAVDSLPPVEVAPEPEEGGPIKKTGRVTTQRAEGGFKPVGIIATIKELLVEGKTEDEFVAVLAARFPDRRAEGMRTTVKCQVKRDLVKKGLPIKRKEVPGRGLVFYLEA